MAKQTKTCSEIMQLAKRCGVADNALFLAACKQYETQQKVISQIRQEIDKTSLTAKKSYISGVENLYANPLVRELPKHADSTTKTLASMLSIIQTFGRADDGEKKLEKFRNG